MFIEEYPGLVPADLCERIIARFEADPHRVPSNINIQGYKTAGDVRTGTSLPLPLTGDWKPMVEAVIPALQQAVQAYAQKYPAMAEIIQKEGLHCTGPIVERVNPGQGFDWHADQTAYSWERVLTTLLYLRTIEDGGATEFLQQGRSIKPEVGKVALFPGGWTHLHRGVSPTREPKYVLCSFWIYDRAKILAARH